MHGTSLDQRVADEIYFPRTRRKAVPLRGELTVEFLDGDRELPVLRLRDAG